jgi:glycosyltransferase involved in cell wall biosynthesis
MSMSSPPGSQLVTVVMVQRDRGSVAGRAIRQLFDATEAPFAFVYVDGRSRRSVRHELDRLRDELGFVVLRADRRITPNQARTIGLREVTTPYVVFVDNDCLVQPGWLATLLQTAEEKSAAVVGPLYAAGDPVPQRVHVAGGFIVLDGAFGERQFLDVLRFYNLPWADVPADLRRQRCDFAEFHCVLIRTDVLVAVGGLDQAMFSTHEHLDVCMRVSAAGGEVWFEPAVVVNFAFPSELRLSDLPYFLWRWSEQATRNTLEHFAEKYGIAPDFLDGACEIVCWLRQDSLFERPRAAAERMFGNRGAQAVLAVLRTTVGPVERSLNRRFIHSPQPNPPIAVTRSEPTSSGRLGHASSSSPRFVRSSLRRLFSPSSAAS